MGDKSIMVAAIRRFWCTIVMIFSTIRDIPDVLFIGRQ
jgi:hypothetical protein